LTRPKWWWVYIDHSVSPTIDWYGSEHIAHEHEQAEIARHGPPFNWEGNDPRNFVGPEKMVNIWARAMRRSIEDKRRAIPS
jgi:hypothetical protein